MFWLFCAKIPRLENLVKEDENFFSEIKLPTAQGDGLMWASQTFSLK